jgi:hypothetical protein
LKSSELVGPKAEPARAFVGDPLTARGAQPQKLRKFLAESRGRELDDRLEFRDRPFGNPVRF